MDSSITGSPKSSKSVQFYNDMLRFFNEYGTFVIIAIGMLLGYGYHLGIFDCPLPRPENTEIQEWYNKLFKLLRIHKVESSESLESPYNICAMFSFVESPYNMWCYYVIKVFLGMYIILAINIIIMPLFSWFVSMISDSATVRIIEINKAREVKKSRFWRPRQPENEQHVETKARYPKIILNNSCELEILQITSSWNQKSPEKETKENHSTSSGTIDVGTIIDGGFNFKQGKNRIIESKFERKEHTGTASVVSPWEFVDHKVYQDCVKHGGGVDVEVKLLDDGKVIKTLHFSDSVPSVYECTYHNQRRIRYDLIEFFHEIITQFCKETKTIIDQNLWVVSKILQLLILMYLLSFVLKLYLHRFLTIATLLMEFWKKISEI